MTLLLRRKNLSSELSGGFCLLTPLKVDFQVGIFDKIRKLYEKVTGKSVLQIPPPGLPLHLRQGFKQLGTTSLYCTSDNGGIPAKEAQGLSQGAGALSDPNSPRSKRRRMRRTSRRETRSVFSDPKRSENIRQQFNPLEFHMNARGPKFQVTTNKPANESSVNGRPG